MNLRKLIDLRTAVAVVCALGLAAACGSSDGERSKRKTPKPNLPSIALDDRAGHDELGGAVAVQIAHSQRRPVEGVVAAAGDVVDEAGELIVQDANLPVLDDVPQDADCREAR